MKQLLRCKSNVSNAIFDNAVEYPTITARQAYLYPKHQHHHNFLIGANYDATLVPIKKVGGFRFHPHLLNQPLDHPINKFLCYSYQREPQTNYCLYCEKIHTHINGIMSCQINRQGTFDNLTAPCANEIQPMHQQSSFVEIAEEDQLVTAYRFVTDASVVKETGHLGVGIVAQSRNEAENIEFSYSVINISDAQGLLPSSTELEMHGIQM